MSVFDFKEENGEHSQEEADGGDRSVRTVSAVEKTNGAGYSTIQATIPADFRDALDISVDDILVMELEDGSDEIRVKPVSS